MMDIEFAINSTLGCSAYLTGVVITFADFSFLCGPIRAVILDSATLPLDIVFARQAKKLTRLATKSSDNSSITPELFVKDFSAGFADECLCGNKASKAGALFGAETDKCFLTIKWFAALLTKVFHLFMTPLIATFTGTEPCRKMCIFDGLTTEFTKTGSHLNTSARCPQIRRAGQGGAEATFSGATLARL